MPVVIVRMGLAIFCIRAFRRRKVGSLQLPVFSNSSERADKVPKYFVLFFSTFSVGQDSLQDKELGDCDPDSAGYEGFRKPDDELETVPVKHFLNPDERWVHEVLVNPIVELFERSHGHLDGLGKGDAIE